MYVLGISAYYHDSAAALLKDGQLVAAIQEERLTRVKHDLSFPVNAINRCLALEEITINDVSKVVFYEKPFWKFERILDSITSKVPFSFTQFATAIPLWVKQRLWIGQEIKKKFRYKGKVLYASHHESHAAAAYFSSGMKQAAILTIDGVGEVTTTTLGICDHGKITNIAEQHYPHSLGLLYSAFTQYCGFKVNSGEYKLMGLAVYGKPIYKQLIYDNLVTVFEDGSYQLNLRYFNYTTGLTMINRSFEKLFGKPIRKPETEIDPFYKDVAASIQEVLEEIVIRICHQLKSETKLDELIFSGGVALNCKLNQRIVESGIFNNHYFYFNPGDAGSAVGAAYLGYGTDVAISVPSHTHSYTGTFYTDKEIENCLGKYGIIYTVINDLVEIAEQLSSGKIIGWYNGKMEFGPRALGNRSILADPGKKEMKDVLNEKIKLREKFRPFAPVVMMDKAAELFELHKANYDTMMVTAIAKPHTTSVMPAVIHDDGTARIQLVSKNTNPLVNDLLSAFYNKTGCPALINTSFNVRGEPIVESPEDAIRTFLYTDMDVLVFNGKYLLQKNNQVDELKKQFKPNVYAMD